MGAPSIKTLGELKASGYKYKSIKSELRDNLIARQSISARECLTIRVDATTAFQTGSDRRAA